MVEISCNFILTPTVILICTPPHPILSYFSLKENYNPTALLSPLSSTLLFSALPSSDRRLRALRSHPSAFLRSTTVADLPCLADSVAALLRPPITTGSRGRCFFFLFLVTCESHQSPISLFSLIPNLMPNFRYLYGYLAKSLLFCEIASIKCHCFAAYSQFSCYKYHNLFLTIYMFFYCISFPSASYSYDITK